MTDQERADWLKARRSFIGASDAAAVAGLTPWATPLQVYLDKLGLLPEQPMTMPQKLGLKMESVIAELYEEATGNSLAIPASLMRHPGTPWIGANPDRVTLQGNLNVQIKTCGFRTDEWGDVGSDEIPAHYNVQVQHEMYVLGPDWKVTHLAALFLQNREFCYYIIPRSDAMIENLVQIETDFWHDHVEAHVPPDPSWGHPSTPDLVKRLYSGVDPAQIRTVSDGDLPTIEILCQAYKDAGEALSGAKDHRDNVKAKLLYQMGDAAVLQAGEYTLTRKEVERKAYMVEAAKYIDFRVKSAKKSTKEAQ